MVYKKQMLQIASTELFNPLVPKVHNSECLKASLQIFIFHPLGANGLIGMAQK